jgi:hypothetical protein
MTAKTLTCITWMASIASTASFGCFAAESEQTNSGSGQSSPGNEVAREVPGRTGGSSPAPNANGSGNPAPPGATGSENAPPGADLDGGTAGNGRADSGGAKTDGGPKTDKDPKAPGPASDGSNASDGSVCNGAAGNTPGKITSAGFIPLADGGKYELRNSCGRPIYILNATEDCGICVEELTEWSRAGGVFDQLKAGGADVVIVSASTPSGGVGSAETAKKLRTRFALGTRFYLGFEPRGALDFDGFIAKRAYTAGARISLILKKGNIFAQGDQEDDPARIKQLLGIN